MKKQLLVGLFLFPTVLQPLLADKLITDSPITVSQERLQTKKITGTILDAAGIPVIGAISGTVFISNSFATTISGQTNNG